MKELVLAIHATELTKQVQPTGLSDFDLSLVDQQAYAMLPRHIVDNKKELLDCNLALGKIFPQILGYFQITDQQGRILTYQRKGKEKGLLGKWSIGVGGHVSHEDYLVVSDTFCNELPDLNEIIFEGSKRELEEELGIDTRWIDQFNSPDDLVEAIKSIIYTYDDNTSTMHVGLPLQLEMSDHLMDTIKLDPAEFLNYKWLTPAELKLSGLEFETWSAILIDHM